MIKAIDIKFYEICWCGFIKREISESRVICTSNSFLLLIMSCLILIQCLLIMFFSEMAMLIQPNPEMQVMIRKELNEQLSSCETDLQIIKEWLWMQPHLPNWDGNKHFSFFCISEILSIPLYNKLTLWCVHTILILITMLQQPYWRLGWTNFNSTFCRFEGEFWEKCKEIDAFY